jgi:hypothetical protein
MRIRLKGINWKRKRLADGSVKTYYWAWKGGPPLRGEPGTPEFVHSYNEAIATKAAAPQGMLLSVLQAYQASGEFNGLAARTRADYVEKIKIIEAKFGDFPLSGLTDRRTRGIFLAWRDELAAKSRRQADYAWQVLARILSWGHNRGLVLANPCARGGRLYRGSRVDKIWTPDDEAAFLKSARAHLHLPLLLALWRPAARRPAAAAVVGLRRHAHPLAAVEDRRARHDSGRHAAQGCARRSKEIWTADPNKHEAAPVDFARLSSVMGHCRAEGRYCRRHVS